METGVLAAEPTVNPSAVDAELPNWLTGSITDAVQSGVLEKRSRDESESDNRLNKKRRMNKEQVKNDVVSKFQQFLHSIKTEINEDLGISLEESEAQVCNYISEYMMNNL